MGQTDKSHLCRTVGRGHNNEMSRVYLNCLLMTCKLYSAESLVTDGMNAVQSDDPCDVTYTVLAYR